MLACPCIAQQIAHVTINAATLRSLTPEHKVALLSADYKDGPKQGTCMRKCDVANRMGLLQQRKALALLRSMGQEFGQD
jgi:hypothetical protein